MILFILSMISFAIGIGGGMLLEKTRRIIKETKRKRRELEKWKSW